MSEHLKVFSTSRQAFPTHRGKLGKNTFCTFEPLCECTVGLLIEINEEEEKTESILAIPVCRMQH